MTDRELLQYALNTLIVHQDMTRPLQVTGDCIERLQAALAQGEQDISYTDIQMAELIMSDCGHSSDYTPLLNRIAGRLATYRQALAQPEQEPVAWMVRDQVDGCRYPSASKNPAGSINGESQPLYTAPPRKPWANLTDDEINDFDKKLRDNGDYCSLHFAWGISAKLKEKNNAV